MQHHTESTQRKANAVGALPAPAPEDTLPVIAPASGDYHSGSTVDEAHLLTARSRCDGDGPADRPVRLPVPGTSGMTLSREELVKLMIDTALALGYSDSAAALERESGVRYAGTGRDIARLRELVLAGSWEETLLALPSAPICLEDAATILLAIFRQQYLESLEGDRPLDALSVLQRNIAPLVSFVMAAAEGGGGLVAAGGHKEDALVDATGPSRLWLPRFAATPSFPRVTALKIGWGAVSESRAGVTARQGEGTAGGWLPLHSPHGAGAPGAGRRPAPQPGSFLLGIEPRATEWRPAAAGSNAASLVAAPASREGWGAASYRHGVVAAPWALVPSGLLSLATARPAPNEPGHPSVPSSLARRDQRAGGKNLAEARWESWLTSEMLSVVTGAVRGPAVLATASQGSSAMHRGPAVAPPVVLRLEAQPHREGTAATATALAPAAPAPQLVVEADSGEDYWGDSGSDDGEYLSAAVVTSSSSSTSAVPRGTAVGGAATTESNGTNSSLSTAAQGASAAAHARPDERSSSVRVDLRTLRGSCIRLQVAPTGSHSTDHNAGPPSDGSSSVINLPPGWAGSTEPLDDSEAALIDFAFCCSKGGGPHASCCSSSGGDAGGTSLFAVVTPAILEQLSSLLLLRSSSAASLRHVTQWPGAGMQSRQSLWRLIERRLSSSAVPPLRLPVLLSQAVAMQTLQCEMHNETTAAPSLLRDHECSREAALPLHCTLELRLWDSDALRGAAAPATDREGEGAAAAAAASEAWGLKFSPDGTRIATFSSGGIVCVVQLPPGLTSRACSDGGLADGDSSVVSAAHGGSFAASSSSTALIVIDTARGAALMQSCLPTEREAAASAQAALQAASPDASASAAPAVEPASTPSPPLRTNPEAPPVTALCWSRDGSAILTCGPRSSAAWLWSTATGELLAVCDTGHAGGLSAAVLVEEPWLGRGGRAVKATGGSNTGGGAGLPPVPAPSFQGDTAPFRGTAALGDDGLPSPAAPSPLSPPPCATSGIACAGRDGDVWLFYVPLARLLQAARSGGSLPMRLGPGAAIVHWERVPPVFSLATATVETESNLGACGGAVTPGTGGLGSRCPPMWDSACAIAAPAQAGTVGAAELAAHPGSAGLFTELAAGTGAAPAGPAASTEGLHRLVVLCQGGMLLILQGPLLSLPRSGDGAAAPPGTAAAAADHAQGTPAPRGGTSSLGSSVEAQDVSACGYKVTSCTLDRAGRFALLCTLQAPLPPRLKPGAVPPSAAAGVGGAAAPGAGAARQGVPPGGLSRLQQQQQAAGSVGAGSPSGGGLPRAARALASRVFSGLSYGLWGLDDALRPGDSPTHPQQLGGGRGVWGSASGEGDEESPAPAAESPSSPHRGLFARLRAAHASSQGGPLAPSPAGGGDLEPGLGSSSADSLSNAASVVVWDLTEGVPVARLQGHANSRIVLEAAFGGSGDALVAVGSEDASAYVWHHDHGGEPVAVLRGHSAAVTSVAWSPVRPNVCATASDDGTVRVWGDYLAR